MLVEAIYGVVSLFIFSRNGTVIFLLVYVDGLILIGNSSSFISQLIHRLNKEFAVKDLGTLKYFLGLEVNYFSGGLTLSQEICS